MNGVLRSFIAKLYLLQVLSCSFGAKTTVLKVVIQLWCQMYIYFKLQVPTSEPDSIYTSCWTLTLKLDIYELFLFQKLRLSVASELGSEKIWVSRVSGPVSSNSLLLHTKITVRFKGILIFDKCFFVDSCLLIFCHHYWYF